MHAAPVIRVAGLSMPLVGISRIIAAANVEHALVVKIRTWHDRRLPLH
jgi:hypothetical protein